MILQWLIGLAVISLGCLTLWSLISLLESTPLPSALANQLRGLLYSEEGVTSRVISSLDLQEIKRSTNRVSAQSADKRLDVQFLSLTSTTRCLVLWVGIKLPRTAPHIKLALSTTRLRERLDQDIAPNEPISPQLDALIRRVSVHDPSKTNERQRTGDRDFDELLITSAREGDALHALDADARSVIMSLLKPREGQRWQGLWLLPATPADDAQLGGCIVFPEDRAHATGARVSRQIQDLSLLADRLNCPEATRVADLLDQLERSQSHGYKERCVEHLLAHHASHPLLHSLMLRCINHQAVELRMIALEHMPNHWDDDTRRKLLLEAAIAHVRPNARQQAIERLARDCGVSILSSHDIPQFMIFQLIEAGVRDWPPHTIIQALSPQIERWTALEQTTLAHELTEHMWRWGAPLIDASLRRAGLTESIAVELLHARATLRDDDLEDALLQFVTHAASPSAQLVALQQLKRHGTERTLRLLLLLRRQDPKPHLINQLDLTIDALTHRASPETRGAITLAMNDDAHGALSMTERGELTLLPEVEEQQG
jgi:hypothetical protein